MVPFLHHAGAWEHYAGSLTGLQNTVVQWGKGEGILDFSLHIHGLQDQAESPNKNMLANEPPSLCASIWKMALRLPTILRDD